MSTVASQIVQLVGSLLCLTAFALAQWGLLGHKTLRYLTLNAVGSVLLAGDALVESQWGFLLLEGVWGTVSFISLAHLLRSRLRTRTARENS
jgi:hypothetical protein